MKKYTLRHKILAALLAISSASYAVLAYAQTRINLNQIQQQATNTILGNFAAGTGNITAQNVASCASAASALRWTTNTGFGCNTAIDAATLGSATFAAPGAIGGGTPGSGAFTTLSSTGQYTNTLAIGTPPFVITSTTNVPNLNASLLGGATFAAPGAIGSGTPGSGAFTTLSATGVITSTLAPGTAPFTVASTTQVANLMASDSAALNGATFAAPGAIGGGTPGSGAFTTLSATGQITSTLASGTAPFVITSTTNVPNLNASSLSGATFAAPGTIGGGTPGIGNFTTLNSGSTSGINFNTTNGIQAIIGGGNNPTANYVRTAGAIASAVPVIIAEGTDANVGLRMSTKGTGDLVLYYNGVFSGGILSSGTAGLTLSGTTGAIQFNTGYGVGTINSDASGNLTSVSDETLKTNIRPFTKGLNEITQINPILFGYSKESGLDQSKNNYPGFSAQNIKSVIPETVGDNGKGKLTLDDRGIIAAMVNAIKQQQQQIKALTERTAQLESNLRYTSTQSNVCDKPLLRASYSQ